MYCLYVIYPNIWQATANIKLVLQKVCGALELAEVHSYTYAWRKEDLSNCWWCLHLVILELLFTGLGHFLSHVVGNSMIQLKCLKWIWSTHIGTFCDDIDSRLTFIILISLCALLWLSQVVHSIVFSLAATPYFVILRLSHLSDTWLIPLCTFID